LVESSFRRFHGVGKVKQMKITRLYNGGKLYEYDSGDKSWFLNGFLHRTDGPAIEFANGDKFWFLNDNLHREDGPAIEWGSGQKEWLINGKLIPCKTQEQFERLMRLKAFW